MFTWIKSFLQSKWHRHHWKITKLLNKKHGMVFTYRTCGCGKKEMDTVWNGFKPYNEAIISMKQYERKWFNEAEPYQEWQE